MANKERVFPNDTFGGKLQKAIHDNNLTRSQFMEKMYGKTYSANSANRTVGDWESGTRKPNIETLSRICDVLNVDADYLLGRIDGVTHSIEDIASLTGLSLQFVKNLVSEKEQSDEPYILTEHGLIINLSYGYDSPNYRLALLEYLYNNPALLDTILAYIHTDNITSISINDDTIDVSEDEEIKVDGFKISEQIIKNSYLSTIEKELDQLSINFINRNAH